MGYPCGSFADETDSIPATSAAWSEVWPPPRSSEILRAYAEALKLDPKSDDWRTSQALAVQESLPKGLTVRRESSFGKPWVNAADIETWADLVLPAVIFPGSFGGLSMQPPKQRYASSFLPVREASGQDREDGALSASTPTATVPAGLSAWELGVGADPARKAESDLRSRTKNPLGIQPSEATFVFVTARRWPERQMGSREEQPGIWETFAFLMPTRLRHGWNWPPPWIRGSPSLFGKRTEGMLDLDEYWKNLAATTEPKLTPGVFLTSRRTTTFLSWSNGSASRVANGQRTQ